MEEEEVPAESKSEHHSDIKSSHFSEKENYEPPQVVGVPENSANSSAAMVIDSCTSDLQKQFFKELNEPLEKAKEECAAQETEFKDDQLKRIKNGQDCFIDDPLLMLNGRERKLLDKFTPNSVIHAILGKHKESGINQKASEHKNSENMTTMTFCHCVNLPTLGIQGYAEESSKKMA